METMSDLFLRSLFRRLRTGRASRATNPLLLGGWQVVRSLPLLAGMVLPAWGSAVSPASTPVIPLPAQMTQEAGQFQFDADTRLVTEGPGAAGAADYFREKIRASRGMAPVASNTGRGNAIVFRFDPAFRGTSPEAYALELKDNRATVTAKDARGLFYGGITLWQLLTADGGKGPSASATCASKMHRALPGAVSCSIRHGISGASIRSSACSTSWRCTSSTPSTGT
jgi:hypothetical protein